MTNDIAQLIMTDYSIPILTLKKDNDIAQLTIAYPYNKITIPLPKPYYNYGKSCEDHIEYLTDKHVKISCHEFFDKLILNDPCHLSCKHTTFYLTNCIHSIIIRFTIDNSFGVIELKNTNQTREQIIIMWEEYLNMV